MGRGTEVWVGRVQLHLFWCWGHSFGGWRGRKGRGYLEQHRGQGGGGGTRGRGKRATCPSANTHTWQHIQQKKRVRKKKNARSGAWCLPRCGNGIERGARNYVVVCRTGEPRKHCGQVDANVRDSTWTPTVDNENPKSQSAVPRRIIERLVFRGHVSG